MPNNSSDKTNNVSSFYVPENSVVSSELDVQAERRMVGNYLIRRPHPLSLMVASSAVMLTTTVSMIHWQNIGGIASLLPANGQNIFQYHEWWRAITTIFVHADWGHLISNMYMLGIFSYFVFGYFGPLIFPIVCVLGAALINIFVLSTYLPGVTLIGASGLVYLLGGLWLTLYFFIQRQYGILNRTLRVLGFALTIFGPTSFVPTTSYRSHLFGFIFGTMIGTIYFLLNKNKILSYESYVEK